MKKKLLSVGLALVLALSLCLAAVVPVAAGAGDVTIFALDQAGTLIEGAQVRLFLWGNGNWMDAKFTDDTGSATYSAVEIADWMTDPGKTTLIQANASDTNGVYGNAYTWAVDDEYPCITYNANETYIFTYNLIMFQKSAPAVTWGNETVTVTYTLGEELTVSPTTPKMGFFYGPTDAAGADIWQAYPNPATPGGWDYYNMIDTDEDGDGDLDDYIIADVTGFSMSAEVPLRFLDGITDNIIAVPFLVKTPVDHVGLTGGEQAAAEDMYGVGSSLTLGLMTISSEAVQMTLAVPAPIISISVSPLSIDFGKVYAGRTSETQTITVTNTSPSISERITATVINESRTGFYDANLTLDAKSVSGTEAWEIPSLAAGVSSPPVPAVLNVPEDTSMGTLTATLVFWAEAAQ